MTAIFELLVLLEDGNEIVFLRADHRPERSNAQAQKNLVSAAY